jgi:tryptophanyl-tRNA synthetase
MKYAFSGGQDTKEKQIKLGANLDIDISYKYLYFFEESDKTLEEIASKYGTGQMLTGEIKQILVEKLWKILSKHQTIRATITDEIVDDFMSRKPLKMY